MNHRSDSEPRIYRIECPNGHEKELCPSSFESFITSGEHDCEECDEPLSFGDGSVDLECHVCQDVFNVSDPEEAMHTMDQGCGACERREFDGQSIHVPDSYQCWDAEYEWMRSGKDAKPLVRETRKDYWEGVIHFCSAGEFASISREGRIRASSTGYFKVPAVCLTEATESGWCELSKRHGEFGFVFRKSDLIRVGGGPALYLSEDRIKAQRWHDDLKPLVKGRSERRGHRRFGEPVTGLLVDRDQRRIGDGGWSLRWRRQVADRNWSRWTRRLRRDRNGLECRIDNNGKRRARRRLTDGLSCPVSERRPWDVVAFAGFRQANIRYPVGLGELEDGRGPDLFVELLAGQYHRVRPWLFILQLQIHANR